MRVVLRFNYFVECWEETQKFEDGSANISCEIASKQQIVLTCYLAIGEAAGAGPAQDAGAAAAGQ